VRKKINWGRGLGITALVVYGIFILFPIYWTVNTSFKEIGDVYKVPPSFVPTRFILDAYRFIFQGTGRVALFNSLVVAAVSTAIAVVLGTMASYAYSRYPFTPLTNEGAQFNLLTVRMFPPIAFLLPIFWMWKRFGLLDTYFALIITYTAFNLPLAVWLLKGFMDALPRSIEEASYIDGYSFWQTVRRVVLPLIGSGLAATVALCWIFIWNEFIIAYLLGGRNVILYTAYLPSLRRGMRIMWNQIAALSVLAIIPSIIILVLFRKYLVKIYLRG